jgi:hypothetical protein
MTSLGFYTEYLADGTREVEIWVTIQQAAIKALEGHAEAFDELAAAQLAQLDPAFAVLRAQEELTAAQKEATKATKKFGESSPEAEEALRKLAEKALILEGAVGDAAGSLSVGMNPALRSTLRAAGLTEGQIADLEEQFGDARREGDKFSKKYTANMVLNGITGTGRKIRSITDDLRDFSGTWTATMITNYKTFGKPGKGGGLAHGGISGAANGATSSNLTWVGENGPELAALPPSTRIFPAGTSQAMMAKSNSSDNRTVLEIHSGGTRLDDALVEILRQSIRVRGGNVQLVLGN